MVDSKIKNEILNIFFEKCSKESILIFLFGSFVNGSVFPSSDYDIGVIVDDTIDDNLLILIEDKLNEKVKTLRDIEIVNFTTLDDVKFSKVALKEVDIWHKNKKLMPFFNRLKML